MKNLHNLQPEPTDAHWAMASWLLSRGRTHVKIVDGVGYSSYKGSDFLELPWSRDSWDYVLREWRRVGSPKTDHLRAGIVL